MVHLHKRRLQQCRRHKNASNSASGRTYLGSLGSTWSNLLTTLTITKLSITIKNVTVSIMTLIVFMLDVIMCLIFTVMLSVVILSDLEPQKRSRQVQL